MTLFQKRLKKGRAFTLVELLVVMTIIAVLSSLMLPALIRAREMARQANCISNLRQIHLAVQMYVQDWEGWYPPVAADILGKQLHRWHGTRSTMGQPFDPAGGPIYPYLRTGEIKMCPSFVEYLQKGGGAFELGCGGYGYNGQYVK
ncbi:type II secretion system protein [bacterium]|nr:type II secretion system protein [bacterium]